MFGNTNTIVINNLLFAIFLRQLKLSNFIELPLSYYLSEGYRAQCNNIANLRELM